MSTFNAKWSKRECGLLSTFAQNDRAEIETFGLTLKDVAEELRKETEWLRSTGDDADLPIRVYKGTTVASKLKQMEKSSEVYPAIPFRNPSRCQAPSVDSYIVGRVETAPSSGTQVPPASPREPGVLPAQTSPYSSNPYPPHYAPHLQPTNHQLQFAAPGLDPQQLAPQTTLTLSQRRARLAAGQAPNQSWMSHGQAQIPSNFGNTEFDDGEVYSSGQIQGGYLTSPQNHFHPSSPSAQILQQQGYVQNLQQQSPSDGFRQSIGQPSASSSRGSPATPQSEAWHKEQQQQQQRRNLLYYQQALVLGDIQQSQGHLGGLPSQRNPPAQVSQPQQYQQKHTQNQHAVVSNSLQHGAGQVTGVNVPSPQSTAQNKPYTNDRSSRPPLTQPAPLLHPQSESPPTQWHRPSPQSTNSPHLLEQIYPQLEHSPPQQRQPVTQPHNSPPELQQPSAKPSSYPQQQQHSSSQSDEFFKRSFVNDSSTGQGGYEVALQGFRHATPKPSQTHHATDPRPTHTSAHIQPSYFSRMKEHILKVGRARNGPESEPSPERLANSMVALENKLQQQDDIMNNDLSRYWQSKHGPNSVPPAEELTSLQVSCRKQREQTANMNDFILNHWKSQHGPSSEPPTEELARLQAHYQKNREEAVMNENLLNSWKKQHGPNSEPRAEELVKLEARWQKKMAEEKSGNAPAHTTSKVVPAEIKAPTPINPNSFSGIVVNGRIQNEIQVMGQQAGQSQAGRASQQRIRTVSNAEVEAQLKSKGTTGRNAIPPPKPQASQATPLEKRKYSQVDAGAELLLALSNGQSIQASPRAGVNSVEPPAKRWKVTGNTPQHLQQSTQLSGQTSSVSSPSTRTNAPQDLEVLAEQSKAIKAQQMMEAQRRMKVQQIHSAQPQARASQNPLPSPKPVPSQPLAQFPVAHNLPSPPQPSPQPQVRKRPLPFEEPIPTHPEGSCYPPLKRSCFATPRPRVPRPANQTATPPYQYTTLPKPDFNSQSGIHTTNTPAISMLNNTFSPTGDSDPEVEMEEVWIPVGLDTSFLIPVQVPKKVTPNIPAISITADTSSPTASSVKGESSSTPAARSTTGGGSFWHTPSPLRESTTVGNGSGNTNSWQHLTDAEFYANLKDLLTPELQEGRQVLP
jgi:hypothetical protein